MSTQPAPLDDEEFDIEFELVEVTEDDMDDEDRAALADVRAGNFISHEAVMRWVESWGTDNPLPKPKCGE